MTNRELLQLYGLCRESDRLSRKIEEAEEEAESIVPVLTDMPRGSNQSSRVSRYAEKICDLKKEREAADKEIARLRKFIEEIQNSTTRLIFRLRYEDDMGWESIVEYVKEEKTVDCIKKRCYRLLENDVPKVLEDT